jgi:hypothetical protein
MSTQELHIHLDLLLQKMSSNWNKNFLPQEVDIMINREITKFLKQRTNPLSNKKRLAMFDTIKRIKDSNTLTKTQVIPVIDINQEEVGIQLPFDFLYPIGAELKVLKNCGVITTSPKITYIKTFKEFTTSGITTLTITMTSISNPIPVVLFDLGALPSDYIPSGSLGGSRNVFIVNNAVLIKMLKALPSQFTCRFNNRTREFEIKGEEAINLVVTLNGNLQPTLSRDTVYSSITTPAKLRSTLEFIDEEFTGQIKDSYLSRSKQNIAKGYLRSDYILIPKIENVVISTASVTYICKPTRVDLLLDSHSELPDDVLEEVISNVAEAIKAVTSSDTYEKYVNENMLIE